MREVSALTTCDSCKHYENLHACKEIQLCFILHMRSLNSSHKVLHCRACWGRPLPAGAPSATPGIGGCMDLSGLNSEELRGQGDG